MISDWILRTKFCLRTSMLLCATLESDASTEFQNVSERLEYLKEYANIEYNIVSWLFEI